MLDRDSGNCVCVGVNASYKYKTHDPLGRKTDGICNGKERIHFAWFLHSNGTVYILMFGISCWEAFKASSSSGSWVKAGCECVCKASPSHGMMHKYPSQVSMSNPQWSLKYPT